MEDRKIKSALEIAMEKAASMSSLTEGELAEQREKEFQPRGFAIARRYIEGSLEERDLQAELTRYRGHEGEIIKRAFLLTLDQSIKLENHGISTRALEGIQAIKPTTNFDGTKKQLEAIFDEFNREVEQKVGTYEAIEKERLEQLGIAGSAVKPDLEESHAWQQEFKRIQSEYDSRINKLKENLMTG